MRTLFLIAAIFGIFFLLLDSGALAGEQPDDTNVYGWAWVGAADDGGPPTYGWLSVNCNNFVNGNLIDKCGDSKYGLHVDPVTGDISGYAWSAVKDPNNPGGSPIGLGWIDFQPNPFPLENPNHVLRGDPRDRNNPSDVSGWFTNETLATYGIDKMQKPDWGWMLVQDGGSPNGAWWDYSVQPPQLHGWMWSGGGTDATGAFDPNIGLGWMSLNCKDTPGGCTDSNYGVTYDGSPDVNGKVNLKGYAWIGAPCVEGEAGNVCKNGKVTNPVGWVSFSCKNDEDLGTADFCTDVSDYRVTYNQKTGAFTGFAYIGGENGGGMWLNNISGAFPDYPQHSARFFFQDTPADPDDPYDAVDRVDDYQAGQVAGWARVLALKDYGITKLGVPSLGWIQLRGNWATESDDDHRGVAIDFDSGAISGWAWGGSTNDTYKDFGSGWIQFSGKTTPGAPFSPTYQAPFIEALQGNIYGQKSVGIDTKTNRQSFAPVGDNFNATYLIQSGGEIQHFVSQELNLGEGSLDPGDYIMPNSEFGDTVTLPQAGNRYQNVLGRLDMPGIQTVVEEAGGKKKNKYGHELVPIDEIIKSSDITDSGWNSEHLGGKIYVVTPEIDGNGTFTIDEEYRWKNGQNTQSGAGLVIINGDLVIKDNVKYLGTPAAKSLGHLASLAWIVLGDITIDPEVTDLAGAYIALGRSDASGGLISTGAANTQLRVSGLLMAKQFQFQRTYIGGDDKFKVPQSSEQVTYDGRLHVNVPPGLEDFSAAFPIQRAALPKN